MAKVKEKPRSIVGARRDYARQWHHNNEGEGTPEECGAWVHEQMNAEWGDRYPAELAEADCVKAGITAQEAAWVSARRNDGDLLGDSYLEAPIRDIDGNFKKVKNTTSEFHDAEREKQIKNLRGVNVSFERDEQRREILKDAGMWETIGMTTGQAAWKSNKKKK